MLLYGATREFSGLIQIRRIRHCDQPLHRLARIRAESYWLHFDHKRIIATLWWAISSHDLHWCKVFYISLKLALLIKCLYVDFTVSYTLWNVEHLLSKVPHTNFSKSQPTFQAVQGKAALTFFWRIIIHIEEHQVRCHPIVALQRVASDKNVPSTLLPISDGGGERINWNVKVRCIQINLDNFSLSTWESFGQSTEYVKAYQLCNTLQFTPKSQNIPHLWPAV